MFLKKEKVKPGKEFERMLSLNGKEKMNELYQNGKTEIKLICPPKCKEEEGKKKYKNENRSDI